MYTINYPPTEQSKKLFLQLEEKLGIYDKQQQIFSEFCDGAYLVCEQCDIE
jgi:hypothetical protein